MQPDQSRTPALRRHVHRVASLIARVLAGTLAFGSARAAHAETATSSTIKVTPIGYVEASYTYDFARPTNGVIAQRGFDIRHDTVMIENAALGAEWSFASVTGRVIIQV